MALTDANRADIRFYLGYSARFHSSDSTLEHAMFALETDPDAEALVLALVVSAKDIDTKLVDAHKRMKALAVGKITLPGCKELGLLRREGRRFVGRMATTLGVRIRHDVFSSSGVTFHSTHWGPSGGSGNYGNFG